MTISFSLAVHSQAACVSIRFIIRKTVFAKLTDAVSERPCFRVVRFCPGISLAGDGYISNFKGSLTQYYCASSCERKGSRTSSRLKLALNRSHLLTKRAHFLPRGSLRDHTGKLFRLQSQNKYV